MKTLHSIDPVVETAWLAESLSRPGLIVIDIRPEEEYSSGHIPGALNLPFAAWKTGRDGLELELPDEAVLFDLLGQAGITPDGAIVIVHNVDNSYPLADACRVADTLIYCGCDSVGILNGGQRKWSEEKRALSKRRVKAKPVKYSHKTAKETFVTKDYVLKALGKAVILDTRDPDVYYGVRQEPHAKRPGHIPGARCLPAPWIWQPGGIYKDVKVLQKMATGVAGRPGKKEIIIYCGVGGYTSAWWFVMTRLLGYTNVKFYDGSAQDWTADKSLPVTVFKWE